MGKHDAKSTAADEAYAADIEKIRKSGPTAGEHVASLSAPPNAATPISKSGPTSTALGAKR
jgi:hypothetical protein